LNQFPLSFGQVGLSPTLALPHGADILREKAAELAKEFRAMLILFGKLGFFVQTFFMCIIFAFN